MIEKSNYDSIVMQKGKQSKWKDQSFIKKDIFSYQINGLNVSKSLKWLNLNEISEKSEKDFCFIDLNYSPQDIVQGHLVGDCYFLSAIASLATNKDRILRLFSSHEISPVGIYMSKLMFKGIIREVVIDDYFPIYIDE
jgi:calpain-15